MQITTNLSKILMFAVVSCSLLLVWDGGTLSDAELSYIDSVSVRSIQPANTIWDSMSSELKLNHLAQSSQVHSEINKMLADPGKLYSILQSAGPYIYFIYQQTQQRGLPAELALIPVIESEYNPNDHSKKGATGLWQLMSPTAHELGVKVVSGYDGRRNVIYSTTAALAYFNDLGNDFKGDWYLAIAAYNCGQGRVESAERHAGNQDFWDLSLPRETEDYVPKLLAIAEIVKHPEKYGIQLPPINNAPYFTQLNVKKQVSLKQVASTSGISIQTLSTLNPDYNKRKVVPKKGTYTLLVPINKAPVVKAKLGVA